jgi:hypothetical protein
MPSPLPEAGFSFSGISVTNASVVSMRAEIEAAFCSAVRVVAFNDRRVFLVDRDRFARPRSSSVMFSSLIPRSSVRQRPPRENRDILEHGFAAVAEAGSFHCGNLEGAP